MAAPLGRERLPGYALVAGPQPGPLDPKEACPAIAFPLVATLVSEKFFPTAALRFPTGAVEKIVENLLATALRPCAMGR